MRASLPLLAAVLTTGSMLGCSPKDDDLVRSPNDLELFLIAEVGRTSGDLKVGNVDCPSRLPAAEGASIECKVELGGANVRYTVQRLVGGRVQARPTKPIVDIDASETEVAKNIGSDVTVDCGSAQVVQIEVGGRIPCTVTAADGKTSKVDLVVEDESGRVKAVDA